jgi:hypothetical protein
MNEEIYSYSFVRACIVYSQNVTLISIVLFMCVISMTQIHPYYSVFQIIPFRNLIWTFSIVLILILQILFSIISILITHQDMPFGLLIPSHFSVILKDFKKLVLHLHFHCFIIFTFCFYCG